MHWLPLLLAETDQWADTFFGLEPEKRFVVLIVAIGCATGIIITIGITIGSVIHSIHHRREEYELKREMLDRGMSAEEISKVIESAPPPEDGFERWIASFGKHKRKD